VIGQSRVAELDMPGSAIETAAGRPAQSYWNESWERLRANRIGITAGLLILLFALIAIMAPLLSHFVTHFQPQTINLDTTFVAPGASHPLGTDELGRDTLTRLIWGGQVTLGVAFLTVAISLTLGTAVGMLAGYYGGWADDILMRLVDTVLAIPAIFLFISCRFCSGLTRSRLRRSSPRSDGAASPGLCGARSCRSSSAISSWPRGQSGHVTGA